MEDTTSASVEGESVPPEMVTLFTEFIAANPSRNRFADDKYDRFLQYLRDPDKPFALRNVHIGCQGKHLSRRYLISNYSISPQGNLQRKMIANEDIVALDVVKESEIINVIWKVHCEFGHVGARRTFEKIQLGYYGVTRMEVRKLITFCETCKTRASKSAEGMNRKGKPNGQFEMGDGTKKGNWLSWGDDGGDDGGKNEEDSMQEVEEDEYEEHRSRKRARVDSLGKKILRSTPPPTSKSQSPDEFQQRGRMGRSLVPFEGGDHGDVDERNGEHSSMYSSRESSVHSMRVPAPRRGVHANHDQYLECFIERKVDEAVGTRLVALEKTVGVLQAQQAAARDCKGQAMMLVSQIQDTLKDADMRNLLNKFEGGASWLGKLDRDVGWLKDILGDSARGGT